MYNFFFIEQVSGKSKNLIPNHATVKMLLKKRIKKSVPPSSRTLRSKKQSSRSISQSIPNDISKSFSQSEQHISQSQSIPIPTVNSQLSTTTQHQHHSHFSSFQSETISSHQSEYNEFESIHLNSQKHGFRGKRYERTVTEVQSTSKSTHVEKLEAAQNLPQFQSSSLKTQSHFLINQNIFMQILDIYKYHKHKKIVSTRSGPVKNDFKIYTELGYNTKNSCQTVIVKCTCDSLEPLFSGNLISKDLNILDALAMNSILNGSTYQQSTNFSQIFNKNYPSQTAFYERKNKLQTKIINAKYIVFDRYADFVKAGNDKILLPDPTTKSLSEYTILEFSFDGSFKGATRKTKKSTFFRPLTIFGSNNLSGWPKNFFFEKNPFFDRPPKISIFSFFGSKMPNFDNFRPFS